MLLIVFGEENKVCQVVINLLGNVCCFFFEDGLIEIVVDFDCVCGIGSILIVDYGEGIFLQICEQIFEWFWCVDILCVWEIGGFGLGLVIVVLIMKVLYGGVDVLEILGGGVIFMVILLLVFVCVILVYLFEDMQLLDCFDLS